MGPKTSKQMKEQALRQRNKADVQDIYNMFEETIEAVRTSKIFSSSLSNSTEHRSKISNLESVFDQLLESFRLKKNYPWGCDIAALFKRHFKRRFEEMWPISKEEFYKLVLSNCVFETMDLRKELQEIARSMEIYQLCPSPQPARRLSYERFFYEVGAAKIEEKLPSSFVGEDSLPWEDSVRHEQETKFNMNAINETIIKHENEILEEDKEEKKEVEYPQVKEADFLPLFVNANSDRKARISENPLSELKKKEYYNNANIQRATVISPQTVFYQRLSQQNKAQIRDLVKFYRQFSNTLEQMFFSSTSILSAPYKHFIYCLEQKMRRKNLKEIRRPSSSSPYLKRKERLLRSEDAEGRKYRELREFNNGVLLTEIKDFSEAYTDFVWMFLELSQIGESKLGKLLNIYTLYGIVVKSLWKFVDWISERGCEYQQGKIEEYYRNRPVPNHPLVPIEKKRALLAVLQTLIGEKNPQKYLKKIVIFYRQANKVCACADDLLAIYQELLVYLVKEGQARAIALFHMPIIVDKLLKLDEALSNAGEICYSWTSWCIIVEIMKERIGCKSKNASQLRVQTEPDYEEVVLEE